MCACVLETRLCSISHVCHMCVQASTPQELRLFYESNRTLLPRLVHLWRTHTHTHIEVHHMEHAQEGWQAAQAGAALGLWLNVIITSEMLVSSTLNTELSTIPALLTKSDTCLTCHLELSSKVTLVLAMFWTLTDLACGWIRCPLLVCLCVSRYCGECESHASTFMSVALVSILFGWAFALRTWTWENGRMACFPLCQSVLALSRAYLVEW